MAVTGPITGITFKNTQTGIVTDLGNYYVSKDYGIDVYPNLVPGRTSPGLFTWGSNTYGGLGNSSNTNSYSSPIQVGSLTNWRQVAAGPATLAIKTDGTLWAWGRNTDGELGLNNTIAYSSPVQVGALTTWKNIYTAGRSSTDNCSIAIKTDGTLWAWGSNSFGELGLSNAVFYSSPVQVGALTDWKSVAIGALTTVYAIKTDGTLWYWGTAPGIGFSSSPVQVGALTDWKEISLNPAFSGQPNILAVKTNGTLWAWGANNEGCLGLNNNAVSYSSPVQVGALTTWKQARADFGVSSAIKTDGTLWAWGWGAYLPLSDISVKYSSPVQVGSLTNWKTISLGNGASLAIKTDGTLWGWGGNGSGQLGLGDTSLRSSPVQVGTLTTWKNVSNGFSNVAAIKDGYI